MSCQHRLLTTRWWPNIVRDVVSLQSCLTALMLQLRWAVTTAEAAMRRECWTEQPETAAGRTLAVIFILFRSGFIFPIDQLLVLVSWGHRSQQSWRWMHRPWAVAWRDRALFSSWLRLLGLVAILVMHGLCSAADRVTPPNSGHIGHKTVIRCFCLSDTINLGWVFNTSWRSKRLNFQLWII